MTATDRPAVEAMAAEKAEAAREELAAWMIANSFATGHGDSFSSLLAELSWQVERLRNLAQKDSTP